MSIPLPAVDAIIVIPFGYLATQLAHVVGHTKTGRVKIRAWNATRSKWMPNTRTLDADDCQEQAPKFRLLGLPKPPGYSGEWR